VLEVGEVSVMHRYSLEVGVGFYQVSLASLGFAPVLPLSSSRNCTLTCSMARREEYPQSYS
jgi:hypothetical protein